MRVGEVVSNLCSWIFGGKPKKIEIPPDDTGAVESSEYTISHNETGEILLINFLKRLSSDDQDWLQFQKVIRGVSETNCKVVILNFSGSDYLPHNYLGTMIRLREKTEVILYHVGEYIIELLKTTNLKLFTICTDQDEAIKKAKEILSRELVTNRNLL